MTKDTLGQPMYGVRDEADLAAIRAVHLPFWLAGGYGSQARLHEALAAGANGVQVGTVFALAEESGMKSEYRSAILAALKSGRGRRRSGAHDHLLAYRLFFQGRPTGGHALGRRCLCRPTAHLRHRHLATARLQQAGRIWAAHAFPTLSGRPGGRYVKQRGLERNTDERRCLCNGLLSCVGLGQVKEIQGELVEEPAIVTLGNHLDGVRRLSRQGQTHYYVQDVVADILG